MRIVFVEVDTERGFSLASVGPAALAAYVRQHGHDAALVRVTIDDEVSSVVQRVRDAGADVLGFSMTTRQWLRGLACARELRTLGLPTLAGGLHATFAADEVLATGAFDAVCLGEGEEALVEALDALQAGGDLSGIQNLQVPGAPRPTLRPPFDPIDALPFQARDLLDEPPGVANISTQRGCPFVCTYCAARKYADLYATPYGRRRSVDNTIAELEHLRETQGLNFVIFLDDTFTLNPPWLKEFLPAYKERIGLPFTCLARVETITQDLIEGLAAAGCYEITYGVESGSERVRTEIMKRRVTNERIERVFRITQDAGVVIMATWILGTPGETREELWQTVALNERLNAEHIGYYVFYPYPGTDLFHVAKAGGYLPDDWMLRPANNRRSILDLRDLSHDDIQQAYDAFTAYQQRRFAERYGANAAHAAQLAEYLAADAAAG